MNSRGFTLIELVVTLAVLTIMMAIALPATSGWRKNAQYKETTRDVVSLLRRARSLAVRQNQIISVTIDPANRKYSLNGAETILPKGVEVEVKEKDTDTWQQAISETINFRPQGSSDQTIFVRINKDDNLAVMVDSTAIGLAHM